jgi:hypothetical protein
MEIVAADQTSEHIRIQLLDPKMGGREEKISGETERIKLSRWRRHCYKPFPQLL